MIAMLHFATLVVATIFAVTAAVLLHWLFLRATFHLMRPATAPDRNSYRSCARNRATHARFRATSLRKGKGETPCWL